MRLPRPAAAVSCALRQAATLAETAHRPWPVPESPWFMGQTWRHLLFAHWAVDPAMLEEVVPPQLPLDLREGRAWVGVTPFRVEGLRLRRTPPAPVVSRFGEVNVRTYVSVDGKPGIYFLSLDAASRLAVLAARRTYRLPYFHARMEIAEGRGAFAFRSRRISTDGPPAELDCRYAPTGGAFHADPGSLEHFLAERYCLYTLDDQGTVRRGEIHHPPWPLQIADGELRRNTMAGPQGLTLSGGPLLHYAARQDVVLWPIRPA